MKKLRDYQIQISNQATTILIQRKIVCIVAMVRTGKTLMALNTCKLYKAKNVLFLTKKKAISSIENDYNDFGYNDCFNLTVINNESVHKVEGDFDLVIMDESHRFGSFPKPSKGAKEFKKRYSHLPLIMLTGTFHPESFSQIYHQFWVSDYSPFPQTNFYKWAREYVSITEKNFGYGNIKDYSNCNYDLIKPIIGPYLITFTQKEAGFTTNVQEHVLNVDMKPLTYNLCNTLKKDLVIRGKHQNIVADTAVKLMQKLHQMYSGTIKFEDGTSTTLDNSKALFIQEYFKGKKIAIYYKFIAELNLLKETFGDNLTTDLDEFNTTDKNIALQFVSGREGISLKNADVLVAYNIDFSATTYFQFRARLCTKDRMENDLYWIFARNGIEEKIYRAVTKKKNFTSTVFKKEYGINFPKQNNK
jgi:hypothetical protein